ncbi:MAG: hypothetical protein DME76_18935 [Verrucomicrobia bacterium]|nr:MAG: hypothetical protein DME76_18935 [Verrucomicrobiota bacterium]
MELADLVLAPSSFVRKTIMQFAEKKVALAPYGVDLDFWQPNNVPARTNSLRFIYSGTMFASKSNSGLAKSVEGGCD